MSTSVMNEEPRTKLAELVGKYGDDLVRDRERVEGLLKDHCGGYRKEISALIAALHERVPQELKSSWQAAMTPEAMRARLVERLEDARGLATPVAAWAVDSWAHALKVPLGRISDRLDSEVVSAPAARETSAPSNGSVWTGGAASTGSGSTPPIHSSAGPADKYQAIRKQAPRAAIGLAVAALCAFGLYRWHSTPTQHGGGTPQPPCSEPASRSGGCVTPQPTNTGPGPITDTSTGTKSTSTSTEASSTSTSTAVEHPRKRTDGETQPPGPADVLPVGTPVRVRVNEDLSSATAQVGEFVSGTLVDPVSLGDKDVIPAGARAVLVVRAASSAGKLSGQPELALSLYQIYLHDKPFHISSNEHLAKGPSRTVQTVKKAGVMGAAGCIVGGVVGKLFKHGGKGCAAGAGAGGAGGVVMSAEAQQRPATIEAESILSFRLVKALSIPAAHAS